VKRFFCVAVLSFALAGLVGCGGGEKKTDDKAAATAHPCTKCKCSNWNDANGDGKCDTAGCDHTAADHGVGSK